MRIIDLPIVEPKNLSKVQKKLWNLRKNMTLCNINGDCKGYVNTHNEYMQEFIAHPKDAFKLPPRPKVTAPLFSIPGLNMFKVLIYEIFRKRTPEEKELGKKMHEIVQNRRLYV